MPGPQLKFIVISIMLGSLLHTKGQADGICSKEGATRAAVNEILARLGCSDYNCGRSCSVFMHFLNLRTHKFVAIQKVLHLGESESNPASSCVEVFTRNLDAPSGYYWLRSANGSTLRVFCDMTRTCKGVGGGWMQVAKLDMTNDSQQCPPGIALRTDLLEQNKSLCGPEFSNDGCSSTMFKVHGIDYSQVCGKIIAYQDGSPDTFGAHNITTRSNNIDGNYVDGISLTHGINPRKHIWTFAGALDEVSQWELWKSYCPCTNIHHPSSSSQPPNFVGNDYFCDTGSKQRWTLKLYPDNPLWDGAGCGSHNTCCSLNDPPWFFKQLPYHTNENIEMRMCRDQSPDSSYQIDEGTPIEILELYIR